MTSMPEIKSATVLPEMRCNGCGAKVGASILSQVMAKLKPVSHDNIIIGLNSPDDASVIQMNHSLLVQSVDSFRAIVDDPYLFGQIAALHALSDLFAMNAQPHSALAIVTLPHADEVIVEREMTQLMQGAVKVLNEHDCALVGGHSSESTEMSLGFSVNGFVENKALMTKSNCQVGDILIITQALGTGALFAAHAQHKAEGEWIEQAVAGMLLSNHQASKIFFQHQAKACTDVTGFGLLGHLLEMLKPVRLSATLNLADLPVLSGVLNCFEQDIKSSLYQQNSQIEAHIVDNENWQKQSNYPLLFDPQTSGGLLATVPPSQSEQCLSALRNAGYADAVVIGCVTDGGVAGDACINLN